MNETTEIDAPAALVVSLNFNPGHFSHLVANYRLLAEIGFTPWLYVHPSFNAMDPDDEFRKINAPDALATVGPVRLAVFWFPSIRNVIEIVRLRLSWRTRVIYVLHEPFESFRRYRASGLDLARVAKIWAINVLNLVVLRLSHAVILPSGSALRCYEKKYRRADCPHFLVPLLFDDEAGTSASAERKRYIAYIGTVAEDHAFDRFVAFAHCAMTEGWFPDMTFAIATSSAIPAAQRWMLQSHVKAGRLVVVEAHPLTNQEINSFFRDSVVVWNAYHRSMQSGVLPKAYMFGAAVIALSGNANEYVQDGVTGVLVNDNGDIEAIRLAVWRILCQRHAFFHACRRTFLETFYYRNWLSAFDAIASHNQPPNESP